MYEFTQDCLTGIDQIDEEHRKLFSLINEAVELPKEARTPQTVKNILEHLSDYAVNHFAHEEAYMEAQNDPELPLQKKEHQAFADHVKLLEKQPLTGENASAMLDEILTYLVRWLYRHILSSDMMIGKMQKEDPFVFTAKYYTGIELVDREHRKLFEIIGEVNALIHNDLLHDKYDEIVRLLDELREYTKFHFEDEEAYMQKINSPMLEAQKRAHQAFVDKLNDRPGTVSAEELERAYRNEGVVVDEMFFPDEDNVIPITDEEYLDDDIVARLCDWLKAVYGAATLEANLDYIAKALGNKGTTSREVIRNYFVNDFFKDHCQTYSVTGSGKRPIYWLFDSGKQNGFKALVYLHRYTPDTIGTLRVDYLHKMQRVYESEINRMQDMMDHITNAREAAAASKRKDKLTKQLKECRDYDEKISHLALSRIALDLDDGVKVNYRKLQTAADGKFYEVLADSKNIMAKEKK